MSIEYNAVGLKYPIDVETFQFFLKRRLEQFTIHRPLRVRISILGNSVMTRVIRSNGTGCIFTIHGDSVDSETNFGRSGNDLAIQELGIFELVRVFGGTVVDPQEMKTYIFDRKNNMWVSESLEPR